MQCLARCLGGGAPWEAVPKCDLTTRVRVLEEQGRAYTPSEPRQDSEAFLRCPLEALSCRVQAIEERQQAQQQAAAEEVSRAVSLAEHAIAAARAEAQAEARAQVQAFLEEAEARISAAEQKAALRVAAAEERGTQGRPHQQREGSPSPPAVCTGGLAISRSARASPELPDAVPPPPPTRSPVSSPTAPLTPPPTTPRPADVEPEGAAVPVAAAAAREAAAEAAEAAEAVAAARAAPATPLAMPLAMPPTRCLRQQGCGCPECSASSLEARGAGGKDGSSSQPVEVLPLATPFKSKNRIARSPQR